MPRGLFLVEHRLPRITEGELSLLRAAFVEGCARLTSRGDQVTYLGSTFLPESWRLLSLFQAADAEVVRNVSASSHAAHSNLEAAIQLPNPNLGGK
jgi:hypothetical protein